MTDTTPPLDFTASACRICLQNNEDNSEQMTYIFHRTTEEAPEQTGLHIHEMIEECAGIKIKRHSQLSSLMCHNCVAFLNIAYKFRTMCRNSQSYLNAYVVKPPDLQPAVGNVYTQQQTQQNNHKEMTSRQNHTHEFVREKEDISKLKQDDLTLKENSLSSHTHSEDQFDYYYDECYLDTEETAKQNDSTNTMPEGDQSIAEGERSTHQFRHKTLSGAPSKTLGISSDGAAVIEDKTELPVAKKAKKDKRTHICEICGNIYDRRYSLVAHMRRHRDEKPYECEICGQAFHCNFELSRHIRKHTGVRPYVCEYCKRAFGDRSTLMKHERIHRNERPYECETCGKSFTYSSVLKVHQLTHTGEKPYNCELCGKRFSRSHHLRAHLETLLHQNDPKSKILLKKIKRAEEGINLGIEIFATA